MLIIRRRLGESFVVFSGENRIEIVVTEIDKSSIKVGIAAKDEIKVFRSEIIDKYLPNDTGRVESVTR